MTERRLVVGGAILGIVVALVLSDIYWDSGNVWFLLSPSIIGAILGAFVGGLTGKLLPEFGIDVDGPKLERFCEIPPN